MAFDLDTNKGKRQLNPEFYGYVPDTSAGRFGVFVLLLLYHGAHVLGNTFSMAVLAQTNLLWLAVYLLADHCGLILYKLTRGDLVYWIPRAGAPLSMLIRFAVKVIVDFTGYARSQPAIGFRPHIGRSRSIFANNTILLCVAAVVFIAGTRWSWVASTFSSTRSRVLPRGSSPPLCTHGTSSPGRPSLALSPA
jgi:hypothetical protein